MIKTTTLCALMLAAFTAAASDDAARLAVNDPLLLAEAGHSTPLWQSQAPASSTCRRDCRIQYDLCKAAGNPPPQCIQEHFDCLELC